MQLRGVKQKKQEFFCFTFHNGLCLAVGKTAKGRESRPFAVLENKPCYYFFVNSLTISPIHKTKEVPAIIAIQSEPLSGVTLNIAPPNSTINT